MRRMSIEPSTNALDRARSLEIELNPDLKVESASPFWRRARRIQHRFGTSVALNHSVFVSLPALALVILTILHDRHAHPTVTICICVLWTLGAISACVSFTDLEEGISQSVDADYVFMYGCTRSHAS